MLLRLPEAAAVLAIGRSTLAELIAAGELPVVRVGRSVRIPLAALHAWAAEKQAWESSLETEA